MTIPNVATLARLTGKAYLTDHHKEHRNADVVTAANILVLRADKQDLDIRDLDVVDIDYGPDVLRISVGAQSVSAKVKERNVTLETPWDGSHQHT